MIAISAIAPNQLIPRPDCTGRLYNEEKTMVKKTYELEELDLTCNWEVLECPWCGGCGEVEISDEFGGGTEECDECGGTGEIAVRNEKNND